MRRPQRVQPGVDLRLGRPFVHHRHAIVELSSAAIAQARERRPLRRGDEPDAACISGRPLLWRRRHSPGVNGDDQADRRTSAAPTPASRWSSRTGRRQDERHLLVRDYPGPRPARSRPISPAARVDRGGDRGGDAGRDRRDQLHQQPVDVLDRASCKRRLGLRELAVINDFVAQALAMPHLAAARAGADRRRRRDCRAAPWACSGAGTGLGVSALIPGTAGWTALPTEGGHVSFAPGNAREDRGARRLRGRLGHVSNERLLSGQGLLNLAQSLAAIDGRSLQPPTAPEAVTEAARAGSCPSCVEAVAMFSALLGRGRRRPRADVRRTRRRLRRRRGLPAAGAAVRPRRCSGAASPTRAGCAPSSSRSRPGSSCAATPGCSGRRTIGSTLTALVAADLPELGVLGLFARALRAPRRGGGLPGASGPATVPTSTWCCWRCGWASPATG